MRTLLAVYILAAVGLFAASPLRAEEVVAFADSQFRAGTVVVKTSERRLYYVLGDGRALRYPVGVGKRGKQWTGASRIVRRALSPAWAPPADVKRDNPRLPNVIAGGTPANPMGAAALVLAHGEYAIHGTNRPDSIGGFVSYGCIRMYNRDVVSLYGRVRVGTPVVVLP